MIEGNRLGVFVQEHKLSTGAIQKLELTVKDKERNTGSYMVFQEKSTSSILDFLHLKI